MPMSPALASLMRGIPSTPRAGDPSAVAPTGPPGGAPPDMGSSDLFGSIVNATMRDTQGADPTFIIDQLKQIKQVTASMFPKVVLRMSGVGKHLTNLYRAVDAAIAEAEKVQSQAQAVTAAQGPINFSGANAQPGPPAGLPAVG